MQPPGRDSISSNGPVRYSGHGRDVVRGRPTMPPSGGWSGSDARGDGDGLSRSRRYAACARSIAIVARVAHTARRVVRKALGSSVGQRRPMPPPKADHAGCGRARFRASCGGRPTPESTLERSYALLLAHRGVEALAMVDVDTNADTNPAHKNMLRPPTQSQYLNLKTTLCEGLRRLHSSPPFRTVVSGVFDLLLHGRARHPFGRLASADSNGRLRRRFPSYTDGELKLCQLPNQ